MSTCIKWLTSPQTEEKIRSILRRVGRIGMIGCAAGALILWTYIVIEIHRYRHTMGSWTDGAGENQPNDWTFEIVLWSVPMLLVGMLTFMVRASKAKKPSL